MLSTLSFCFSLTKAFYYHCVNVHLIKSNNDASDCYESSQWEWIYDLFHWSHTFPSLFSTCPCTTAIWLLLVLKSTCSDGCIASSPFFFYSIDIVYVFIQWLYLKLLNFSFRSSSASLWIPERKQGWAASFRNTLLVFNTFFPECLPCDSIRNSPAFSWKTISYFLAFLCQCYPGLWLMLTSVIFCDFPPKLSISTPATERCSPIHSNYERDIWDSWKRILRIKKWDGKQQSLLSQMHSRSQLRLSSKLPLKSLRILLACPMLWSLFFIYYVCVWTWLTLLRCLKHIVLSCLCSFARDNQGQPGFFPQQMETKSTFI